VLGFEHVNAFKKYGLLYFNSDGIQYFTCMKCKEALLNLDSCRYSNLVIEDNLNYINGIENI
jgi:hypothetical protein